MKDLESKKNIRENTIVDETHGFTVSHKSAHTCASMGVYTIVMDLLLRSTERTLLLVA